MMVVIAMIGILAAIAIPNYIAFRDKGYDAMVEAELNNLLEEQTQYYRREHSFASELGKLGHISSSPEVKLRIIHVDTTCFEIQGKHPKSKNIYTIDCTGEIKRH